jgi:hypothetical protein
MRGKNAQIRKRMRSGDRPGLQNRRAAGFLSPVCSTHTRFRQNKDVNWPCAPSSSRPTTFECACFISFVATSP